MSVVLFVCVVVPCVLYYLLSYIILQKRHCEIIAHCPLDKLMHIEVITDISPFIHVVFIIYRSVIIFILQVRKTMIDYAHSLIQILMLFSCVSLWIIVTP